ncbi:MAG TPA: DUF4337 domain-containing protein [Syntrophobacteraceae bacterium]|nr:DUF4337 domain-containing protein [Syntrophobacteraceae bacterium]
MSDAMPAEQDLEREKKRFEIVCALTLAVFAALLAITDLGASKYGDDEIMGTNEKANIYAWFQSKSVKQSLVEGQRDLVKTLMEAGSIDPAHQSTLEQLLGRLEQDIARYKKEKRELLLGSAKVGKENWVQDIDGELGKIVGAKEWEAKLSVLGQAGDKFDLALLFLQVSLVIGAVSLVLQENRLRWLFYGTMSTLGILGLVFSVWAFFLASSA